MPCILSLQGVFRLDIFLSVALSELKCISASRPSSSSCNSFFILFIHSAFLLCSFHFHILLQNCFVSFACWFVLVPTGRIFFCYFGRSFQNLFLCTLYQFVGGIFFHYFGKSSFVCIAWPYSVTFWVSLLSPISFDLFLPAVLSDLSVIVIFYLFILLDSWGFNFFSRFTCCSFFICPSILIFLPCFVF